MCFTCGHAHTHTRKSAFQRRRRVHTRRVCPLLSVVRVLCCLLLGGWAPHGHLPEIFLKKQTLHTTEIEEILVTLPSGCPFFQRSSNERFPSHNPAPPATPQRAPCAPSRVEEEEEEETVVCPPRDVILLLRDGFDAAEPPPQPRSARRREDVPCCIGEAARSSLGDLGGAVLWWEQKQNGAILLREPPAWCLRGRNTFRRFFSSLTQRARAAAFDQQWWVALWRRRPRSQWWRFEFRTRR